jgi:hypothetical protein
LTDALTWVIIHRTMNYTDGGDPRRRFVVLLSITAGYNALWAGAAAFRVLVDLPARYRLGPLAFADLSRATDLSAGLVFYPVAAIGSALLACATWVAARRIRAAPTVRIRTTIAAVSTLAVLAVTVQAAPIMFNIGSSGDPAVLVELANRFALITDFRAALAVIAAVALLVALALCAASQASRPERADSAPPVAGGNLG